MPFSYGNKVGWDIKPACEHQGALRIKNASFQETKVIDRKLVRSHYKARS